MKLQDQVCTLEQAKRLDTLLGVDNPSAAFYWHFDSGMKWRIVPDGYFDREEEGVEFFAAFSVAELCVMLPGRIDISPDSLDSGHSAFFRIGPQHNNYMTRFHGWCAIYPNSIVGAPHLYKTSGKTLSEGLANLLIHLLERNLTAAAEVNARLSQTVNA